MEPELLDAVSTLGSGTRVIGVYKQRWASRTGDLLVYLHGVEDPGNVGTIIRSAHALADATVVLGRKRRPVLAEGRAGRRWARSSTPPARATLDTLDGHKVALDARAESELRETELEAPLVLVPGVGARELPEGAAERCASRSHRTR